MGERPSRIRGCLRGAIERGFERGDQCLPHRRVRLRHARRRHHSAAYLTKHLFPHIGMGGDVGEFRPGEAQAAGLRAVVMAADAVGVDGLEVRCRRRGRRRGLRPGRIEGVPASDGRQSECGGNPQPTTHPTLRGRAVAPGPADLSGFRGAKLWTSGFRLRASRQRVFATLAALEPVVRAEPAVTTRRSRGARGPSICGRGRRPESRASARLWDGSTNSQGSTAY